MSSKRVFALLAVVVLSCAAVAAANPVPGPPRPQPLVSLDELLSRFEGEVNFEFTDAITQVARLGPEYTWLLVDLAEREDLEGVSFMIFDGLVSNGDLESLSVLRAIVADTARSDFVRALAAEALTDARDHDAIPLLEEIAVGSHSERVARAMRRAIREIESPGRYRPLFGMFGESVRFGFLLDDIESVRYSDQATSVELQFETADFRHICDLLHAGQRVELEGGRSLDNRGTLTFTLGDGAEGSLRTDGELFGRIGGAYVKCVPLGELIRSRLDGDRTHSEPPN